PAGREICGTGCRRVGNLADPGQSDREHPVGHGAGEAHQPPVLGFCQPRQQRGGLMMKARSLTHRAATLMGALLLLLVLAPLGVAQAQAIDNSSPQKLVETSAQSLLADLDANRAAYRRDISGLYKVIDE